MADSIEAVLQKYGAFHDYRLGHLSIAQGKLRVSIEDFTEAKHAKDSRSVGFLSFSGIEEFNVTLDLVLEEWIYELIEIEPGHIEFDLDNGSMLVKANVVVWENYEQSIERKNDLRKEPAKGLKNA